MNLVQTEAAPAAYRFYDFAFRAIRAARIDRAFDRVGGARGVIFALQRSNRVFFASTIEAKGRGFRPCGQCLRGEFLSWRTQNP